MLEVGWSELLVIAIILIVVVGPKDLPAMMRTFGKMMGRVRSMANEFRSQFDEAMREAELDEVRKGLGEVNKYNPANTLRDAMNPIRQFGQDIKSDLQKASDVSPKPVMDEGTPVAQLASDPAVDPEPATVEPVKAEPAAAVAKPAPSVAAPVTPVAVASEPVATVSPTKPARRKKAAEVAADYPPPAAKKPARRKAAEPPAGHDVQVVAAEAKPVTAARKAAPKAKAEPTPRKKTPKATDA